ncbi:MAG TPA: sigma-54 dependent transcriptional regulator [Candidatus Acidoferrales bacterium]|nr:sigma-54 dependent transcriptional regulator [Candidatus Acidoferrales bacterium]
MEPVLLVEDKAELRGVLRKALERAGWKVEESGDATAAIEKARNMRYLLVLTDLKLPGGSGLDVLRAVKEADPDVPVILMTAYGSVEEAVTAMKEGAFDFIQKPVDLDHLKILVERAARQQDLLRENLVLREEYAARYGFPRIVGEHPAIQTAGQQVQRVAATDSTVLLLGESGTGKELFARAIHHLSRRREHPFVALNCAAIPEGLVENELFGHEKGAYTGAGARKLGKMEMAHRGTLFLDEIAELPLMTQAKLLRVLEERRFERVGGTQAVDVDARILCATNKNLEAAVAEKSFREDLYFRIAAVPLTIPPLRERGEDVLLLAAHFLERFCRELSKPGLHLSQEARERVLGYEWPGNIRELQNAIERAVILADGAEIETKDLRLPSPRPAADGVASRAAGEDFSWEGTLDDVVRRVTERVERFKIEAVLRGCKWNKTRAAEQLGISYKTLLNKIRDLGIPD